MQPEIEETQFNQTATASNNKLKQLHRVEFQNISSDALQQLADVI